jgi:hypothetical protein
MIDHYTVKLAPGHEPQGHHGTLSEGKELAPDDLARLSKVKAKIEIVGTMRI